MTYGVGGTCVGSGSGVDVPGRTVVWGGGGIGVGQVYRGRSISPVPTQAITANSKKIGVKSR